MADILQTWLNKEIELSRPVDRFEEEFANGYLFGELLYKFNQQPNFPEFTKKENVAAKIDNFTKLQPTLRNLGIKFDSKLIDGIMKAERGLALRLLYQLKMALEKVYPPTDVNVLKKTGKIGDNRPAMKIPAPKEKYEAQAHTFFHQRLQVMNKPQKQIIMEKHLQKFDDELVRQDQVAKAGDNAEKFSRERRLAEMRAAQINKVQRNAGFMEEWQQKGVADWQQNQTKKKERERRDLEFEYKETEKYHQLALTKIDEASKEVHDGIKDFEKTLKKTYGISTKVNKHEAERAVSESIQNQADGGSSSPMRQTGKSLRYSSMAGTTGLKPMGLQNPFANSIRGPATINQVTGPMTLTTTGLRSKDKKVIGEANRKDRERRRRKMIVDQMKTYNDMESKRREDQVLDRMKWMAKQEEELVYEKWRTEQCKNVIIDNRKLREARYDKRREIDTQTAQWREEEMLRAMREQVARDVETLKERDTEMRIVSKQAHRERRNEFGAVLFDAIFEIANEAYIHQQESDTNDIDSRNWHEWLQLFVEQMPIQGTLSKLADLKGNHEDATVDPHKTLDDMELVDYLKNQGQWTKDIITENPPNLEQFLTGQADSAPAAAAGKAPAKGAPAKAATEAITLEEGDAELPTEAPNNYQLGDAIEQIVNLNYEARAPQKRSKMPQHLNLKLAFIGYAFAGKKKQATVIQQLYGLQTYQLNDLVTEALNYYEANPNPIEKPEQPLVDEQEFTDAVSEDSEIDEEFNGEEDFRLCGEQISNLLKEGQEINDETYVKLYCAKLRLTYPHKSKKQIRRELKVKVEKQRELQKKIEPLEKDLAEIAEAQQQNLSDVTAGTEVSKPSKKKNSKDSNQVRAKIEEYKKEIEKLDEVEKNGWILVDFPSTFAQAKLLETALSGFVPKQECEPIDREKQIDDAQLLVQPTAREQPPKVLIKSGLDAVIWFDLSREECMRRALGRRFDPEEEKVYHVEDIPPPTDQAPLCERLVSMNEDDNSEATLIDRWISFDQGSKALENWVSQFGDAKSGQSILYKLQAEPKQEGVSSQIKEILESILLTKMAKEQAIKARIHATFDQADQAEAHRIAKLKEEEEESKRRLEEGGEGAASIEVPKKDESKVERPEPATERVAAKEAGVTNIDNDFKPTILKVWQELSANYKHQMKKVFRQVRTQRERITSTFSHTQNQYLEFIHRPDTKQERLEQFIRDFNDFSDQFPDLREDEATKDELHQRVDILSDELWEIIEERKEQHVDERKKIMESGWVEHELAFMVNSAQSLMQAEVDKFKSSIQIIQDYYHAFEDKVIPEPPAAVTQDLIADGEDLPAVESLSDGADATQAGSYLYPRLDKIFEKALKAQFVPDVTLQSAAGGDKKGAPPAKGAKDPKKPAEDEKPTEDSQYVKEMRQAIKVEKSILRYRLTQIRNWTLKRLRDIRLKAIKVYTKLEDWIYVANKAENDSVDEMCIVLKRAIEEERKIQDELRIRFMDFCVDEKIMNFIEPPPEKLPAMEQVRKDRFSIKQLKTLVNELEELARQHGDANVVPNKLITDLLLRKLENSKTLQDDGSLPEQWWTLKEYDFQNIVRNLDRTGQGVVSWKQLATYIILLRTPLPTDKDLETYKKSFGAHTMIDLDTFLSAKSWFDQTEFSKDRDYSIPFPRLKLVKELLFSVNREHALPAHQKRDERLSIEDFIKLLTSAKQVIQGNIIKKSDTAVAQGVKTYGDVLFMQANLADPNGVAKKKKTA